MPRRSATTPTTGEPHIAPTCSCSTLQWRQHGTRRFCVSSPAKRLRYSMCQRTHGRLISIAPSRVEMLDVQGRLKSTDLTVSSSLRATDELRRSPSQKGPQIVNLASAEGIAAMTLTRPRLRIQGVALGQGVPFTDTDPVRAVNKSQTTNTDWSPRLQIKCHAAIGPLDLCQTPCSNGSWGSALNPRS